MVYRKLRFARPIKRTGSQDLARQLSLSLPLFRIPRFFPLHSLLLRVQRIKVQALISSIEFPAIKKISTPPKNFPVQFDSTAGRSQSELIPLVSFVISPRLPTIDVHDARVTRRSSVPSPPPLPSQRDTRLIAPSAIRSSKLRAIISNI